MKYSLSETIYQYGFPKLKLFFQQIAINDDHTKEFNSKLSIEQVRGIRDNSMKQILDQPKKT